MLQSDMDTAQDVSPCLHWGLLEPSSWGTQNLSLLLCGTNDSLHTHTPLPNSCPSRTSGCGLFGNRVMVRLYSIRVGPRSYVWHSSKMAMWWQRLRCRVISYKPKDSRDFLQTIEARREAQNRFFLRTSEEDINPTDTVTLGFSF